MPFVSVVVPYYKDPQRLARCLTALHGQSYPAARRETLLVDNSRDGLPPDIGSRWEAEILRSTGRGSYGARNVGVRTAKGTVLAFTDEDCVPERDWLSEGVRSFQEHGRRALLAGRIALFLEHQGRANGAELHELLFGFPQKRYVEQHGFAATANLIAAAEAFAQVGAFEERVPSGGDLEWCQRARRHGYRVVYAPNVVVRHPVRDSLRKLMAKARRVTEGSLEMSELLAAARPPWERAFTQKAVEAWRQASRILVGAELEGPWDRLQVLFVWGSLRIHRVWCRVRWSLRRRLGVQVAVGGMGSKR